MARQTRKSSQKRSTSPAAAPEGPSGWEALSGGVQHAVCIGVLLVISVAFFASIHFSGKGLAPTDTIQWRAMAADLLDAREATGELVLWAPNAFAGMPGYTISYPEVVPQVDDLVDVLRPLLWPTSHFLVLLLGTYFLVVFLTRNRLAGLLAACAYGLTTYLPVIIVAGHNTKFVALSYAPWMALAFANVLRNPKLLPALLFAIAAAVNLRAGHIQVTYYFTFLLGLWWLVEGIGALRHGRARRFGVTTGWLALGAVLAVLMVAQPYLTLAEYKSFSMRGGSGEPGAAGLAWEYAMAWSQGWGELATLVVAHAYGGSQAYWGPKTFTGGPHYVGGIVLLLALLAVWRRKGNVVLALGIGAVVMTFFALGENLAALNRIMFNYFPLFNAFRVPETWLSAVAFALAVLAGLGVAYAVQREPTPEAERDKTRALYTSWGIVAGLVLVLFLLPGAFFDFERPAEAELVAQQIAQQYNVPLEDPRVTQTARQYVADLREQRADMFSDDALRTLLFLLLTGLVFLAYRKEKAPAWAVPGALALFVVVDLWGVGHRYLNEEILVPDTGLEQQIPTYDFDRYLLEQQEAAGGAGHFRVLSLEQGSPFQNARPSYFYESLGGYSAARLRLYQDFMDHLFIDETTGLPGEAMLDLLNTRYVVARGQLPGYDVVYRDEQTGLAVLENPDVLPRAFFVDRVEVAETAEATWARLQSPDFDPARTAILPEPVDFETTPLDTASTTSVELQSYTPDEIVWRVQTDAPRLLVVSEVYYPAGWEATLDGEAVPIYRADYLLRAVPIPAGEHTLVMRFDPQSHETGVLVAGATTALVYGGTLLLLGLAWQRRRRERIPQDVQETEA